jgi:hypothetical protein
MSLCGCATKGADTAAALANANPVVLPDACEALLKQQPVVQPHVGDDYRVLFRRARNGQIVENAEMSQTRQCLDFQRKLYEAPQ